MVEKNPAVTFQSRHWRWLLLAVSLSVGAIILFNVLAAGNALAFFARLSPPYLVAAFLLVPLLWLAEAWRVQVIVRAAGGRLDLWPIWQANLAAAFMAAITPAAAGGPPTQIYLLARLGLSAEKAAAVVVARLLLNLAFFALLAPPLFFLYRETLGLGKIFGGLVLVAAIGLSGIVGGFFYLLFRSDLAEKLIKALAAYLPPAWFGRAPVWERRLTSFRVSLAALLAAGWRSLLLLAALTVGYWFGFFSLALLLIRSLGLEVGYGAAVVRQVLYYFVISYVPLPGASGVAELGLAVLFATVVPQPLLPGFVAAWRFLTYHLNILSGGPLFWLLLRQPTFRPVREH